MNSFENLPPEEKIMKLFCAIVGVAKSVFSVRIDEGNSVDDLKKAIKAEYAVTITCDAKDLQLFLAKRKTKKEIEGEVKDDDQEEWLTQLDALKGVSDTSDYKHLSIPGARLRAVGLARCQLGEVSNEAESVWKDPVNVLVVVPKQELTGKRSRLDQWCVIGTIPARPKKRKVDEDDYKVRYFRMKKFPPLEHPNVRHTTIMERKSSIVIFTGLMRKVKTCLESESNANMVVTGNPGTGKSRFYLYCIFQLLYRHEVEVQELPSFELVLNCGTRFHKYCSEDNTILELNEVDVRELSDQRSVIRLIEGNSSQLNGWKGVSILFASCLANLNSYAKTSHSYKYIMPTWSLDELQDYNSLLSDTMKLSDDILVSRYKFGGIPRSIFTSA